MRSTNKQQRSLATMNGFERYTKKTRRQVFLEEMEQVVPWREVCALIEPHYPKAGNGRPPVGVERMLRIYFLQQWFNLSDPAVEEALYDSPVMRQFVGIDLGQEPAPDETTACKFPARAHVDQEPRAAARSGDAPDQERQPVVLRDKDPCRSGYCRMDDLGLAVPRRPMWLT